MQGNSKSHNKVRVVSSLTGMDLKSTSTSVLYKSACVSKDDLSKLLGKEVFVVDIDLEDMTVLVPVPESVIARYVWLPTDFLINRINSLN